MHFKDGFVEDFSVWEVCVASLFTGYHCAGCLCEMSLSGVSVSLMAARNVNRQVVSLQDVSVREFGMQKVCAAIR